MQQGQFVNQLNQEFNRLLQQSFSLTDDWINGYQENYVKPQRPQSKMSVHPSAAITPNKMQAAALSELEDLYYQQHASRGLIVSATGTGKTYLANQFETPLMLNTDGNYKQVDAPVIRIIDEVSTEGRITKRKYAWEVFKETIDELEKGSDFKTIIVDLLEDVYDACRVKVCSDNGWDHESDDSFKAYDIVRSEFLRTLKRLLNLDYNIVLISHEDTSRDITKRTGDKVTAIKPNLQEKLALKVAGMVDMVVRIINDEGKRTISFKSNEVEFGGGRLNIKAKNIPCTYEDLMKVYGDNQVQPTATVKNEVAVNEPNEVETPEKKVRTRKPREVVEEAKEEAEEPATTRRRRRRVEE